jgi:hypothetical protein
VILAGHNPNCPPLSKNKRAILDAAAPVVQIPPALHHWIDVSAWPAKADAKISQALWFVIFELNTRGGSTRDDNNCGDNNGGDSSRFHSSHFRSSRIRARLLRR